MNLEDEKKEISHLDQMCNNNYEQNNLFRYLSDEMAKLPDDDSENNDRFLTNDNEQSARRDTEMYRDALEGTLDMYINKI